MKRKRLGQSQTRKVVRARKLWKRCPNLTNSRCYYYSAKKKKKTHGAIRLFPFISFFYVKCQEETNVLYCICDLYEFEKLAKNSRIPTFFSFFFSNYLCHGPGYVNFVCTIFVILLHYLLAIWVHLDTVEN